MWCANIRFGDEGLEVGDVFRGDFALRCRSNGAHDSKDVVVVDDVRGSGVEADIAPVKFGRDEEPGG